MPSITTQKLREKTATRGKKKVTRKIMKHVLARFANLDMDPDFCAMWKGATNEKGYGLANCLRRSDRKHPVMMRAHRAVWELVNGPIPRGKMVLHSCHTPACVNIHHLRLGTHAENMRDRREAGRVAKGESIWSARLTPRKVKEIRRRKAEGEIVADIARDYPGVGYMAIWRVVKGKTWAHVGGEYVAH